MLALIGFAGGIVVGVLIVAYSCRKEQGTCNCKHGDYEFDYTACEYFCRKCGKYIQ